MWILCEIFLRVVWTQHIFKWHEDFHNLLVKYQFKVEWHCHQAREYWMAIDIYSQWFRIQELNVQNVFCIILLCSHYLILDLVQTEIQDTKIKCFEWGGGLHCYGMWYCVTGWLAPNILRQCSSLTIKRQEVNESKTLYQELKAWLTPRGSDGCVWAYMHVCTHMYVCKPLAEKITKK